MQNQYLYHYGVKGMRWGVRRYQNADGSLTAAGKKRLVKRLVKDDERNNHLTFNRRVNSTIGEEYRKSSTGYKDALAAKGKQIRAYEEANEAANEAAQKAAGGDFMSVLGDAQKLKVYMKTGSKVMKELTNSKEYQKILSEVSETQKRAERESREYVDKILGDYGNTPLKNVMSIKVDTSSGKTSQQTVADRVSLELIRDIMHY